jgi:hypothetical protein
MKCPGNPEHEGIRIKKRSKGRFSDAFCAVKGCGRWIECLGEIDSTKPEILGIDLSIEFTNEIRRIAREEIQKQLGGESQ